MSTNTREALAGSRWSRGQNFAGMTLVLVAIRLLVSANLLYAAIFLKFAAVPDSVALFTRMSQAVHGLISQPVFRLGSGAFETVVALLILIPKTARWGAGLTVAWMTPVILSHIFVFGIWLVFCRCSHGHGTGSHLPLADAQSLPLGRIRNCGDDASHISAHK
jgi:hypothetical protein